MIPPEELSDVLDNIGLPNSTINTVYSNSGVIGTQDAEILIGLKPDRKMSTDYYVDELRGPAESRTFPARNSSSSPRTSSARF